MTALPATCCFLHHPLKPPLYPWSLCLSPYTFSFDVALDRCSLVERGPSQINWC
ncbi:hypothetical protein CPB86DRAFT_783778 [Serendipita vermifera]|nr:hypothetical protein CPB86DRAFT_783778 [Serendipita vermifera]